MLFVEFNEDGTVGGSHKAMAETLLALPKHGFEPLACFNEENRFADLLRTGGVPVHVVAAARRQEREGLSGGLAARRLAVHARKIARRVGWLRAWGVDLLHLNNHPALGSGDWIPAALLLGIPVVSSARGLHPDHSAANRFFVRRVRRILCDSDWAAAQFDAYGVPRERVETVYLGVDAAAHRASVSRSRNDVRAEFGFATDDIVACMVGNVRHWKGHHAVIEAIALMPDAARRGFRMLFVGDVAPVDRGYREMLDARAAELGITANVAFAGVRTKPADFVAASDVAVHASVTPEPFGTVVIEAMALGKPVVVANAGGPAEIVTAGSGLLHDPADPRQLAGLLGQLAVDPGLRQRLGTGALARVEFFALDRHVATTARIYRDVLGLPS